MNVRFDVLNRAAIALFAAALMLVAARVSAQAQSESPAAFLAQYFESANAHDLTRTMAAFADDAVMLPPRAAPIVGRAAISARFAGHFHDSVFVSGAFADVLTHASDELAVQQGTVAGTDRLNSSGTLVAYRLHFTIVVKREKRGPWRIVTYIWNDATPAPGTK